MFMTATIVFREVLEAALIIGIIAAATRNVPGRKRWLAGGVVAGLVGASVVAASANFIGSLAGGIGQALLNSVVLGVAVLMLAWHNIWMASHGAQLAADARAVGQNIRDGSSELSALLLIVGLAVLREGSETVLFLYGIAISGGNSATTMLAGGIIGVLAGVLLGYLLYAGLVRIPLRWFFTATSLLVLLLAAGMASQVAHFLIQADLLPSLTSPLWDTSHILPEGSWTGKVLHSLIGYDARPAEMQLIFYITALVVIGAGMKWAGRRQRTSRA